MAENNSTWTDKAKAFLLICIIPLAIYLVWQQTKSKVSPEEIAATQAMKTRVAELTKNYESLKKEKGQKIAVLQEERIILEEKAGKLEKELLNRDQYYAEILQAKQTGDYEEIIKQADICYQSREAEIKLRESIEKELAEMTTLYHGSDKTVKSLQEQMQIQLQATQECQEKRMPGRIHVYAGFGYGFWNFEGLWHSGWNVNLSIGYELLEVPI